MKYRCLIIDQQNGEAGILVNQLKTYNEISVIGFAENESDLKKKLMDYKPNLIFVDPEWPFCDLTKLSNEIKLRLKKYLVVIISKKSFILPFFKENIIDYLQKPFNIKSIDKTLRKLNNILTMFSHDVSPNKNNLLEQTSKIQKLAVNNGDHIGFIDLIDICYFKADHKYTAAHTFDQSHLINKSLTYLQDQLPEIFVRIHKSYLVNLLRINTMINNGSGKYSAIIADKLKSEVPISRSGKSKLNEFFIS